MAWLHGAAWMQVAFSLLLCLVAGDAMCESGEEAVLLQRPQNRPAMIEEEVAAPGPAAPAPPAPAAPAPSAPAPSVPAPPTPPRAVPPPPARAVPPPPAARQDTRVVLNGVTGTITSFQSATKADTIAKATEICKARKLIDAADRCIQCTSADDRECCVEFKQVQDGKLVSVENPSYDGAREIQCLFTLSVERGMDADLIEFVHQLALPASGRRSLLTQFQGQGVRSKSQLAGINPVDLDLSAEDSLTRNNVISQLSTEKDKESEKLSKSGKNPSTADVLASLNPARTLTDQVTAQATEALRKADSARQALADATEQVAEDGNRELSEKSRQALNEALAQLNQLNLNEADLDLSSVSSQIDGLISSGGFVNGRKLGTMETVEKYGLLRGVLVTDRPGVDGVPVDRLAPVCSFKPRLAKSEDQLKAAIAMDADLESTEYFLEAEDAKDVQTANSIISSYGTSAMSALANNFGAGLSASGGTPNFVGTASAGVSESRSSSRGEATRGRETSTRLLQTKTKELSKTRYYFMPKLAINIDPYQLEASPEFRLSWSEVAYLMCQKRGEVGCSRFEVSEDNVYGVTFQTDTKPDESKATTLVSFVATNYKAGFVLSSSKLPKFTEAIKAAFNSAFRLEDGEDWTVEVDFASALVVSDPFSNVQVVVKIPPKPFPGARPTDAETRADFMRKWLARGWMQTNILGQLKLEKALLGPEISLGEHDLTRLTVSTEPSEASEPTANSSALIQRHLFQEANASSSNSRKVTDALIDQTVRELIYKFGSHICPDAVLGGYWRIDAKYSSIETKDRVEVDNLVSLAIQSAETESRAFSASAGAAGIGTKGAGAVGATAEGAESNSNSDSSDSTGGDAQDSETASKSTKLTIEQAWKGGAEGTLPGDWRRSLDESFSSNWKIIDHVFPKCVGIWRFVEDEATRRKLCETWLNIYLDEGPNGGVTRRIEDSVRQKACESTLSMNAVRQEAQELVRLDSEASTRLTLELCEGNKVYNHFRFVPTKLRDANETMAAVRGVRLGLDKEPLTPTTVEPTELPEGGFEIPLGDAIYLSFSQNQSVTDFAFLLTADQYGKDPVQFKVQAAKDKDTGPWVTLLSFTMDARAQLLSSEPAPGESTTFREAWSRWLLLQGAAEGYYWDSTDELCKEKQCFCTAANGTNVVGNTGRRCAADNGAVNCPTCCKEEQRAICASFDCTTVGPTSKSLSAAQGLKCVSGLCKVEADALTCCQDSTVAKNFVLTVKTKNDNNCGSGLKVKAILDGVTVDGDEVSNDKQTLETKKFTDWKKGSVRDYVYVSKKQMRPSQICLIQVNDDNDNNPWCPEYVRVKNGEIAGAPQIGIDVTGWTVLDNQNSEQCLNLDFQ